MTIDYRVLTPRRIVTVTSASNSVHDIGAAIKAAGINPRTVLVIEPVES